MRLTMTDVLLGMGGPSSLYSVCLFPTRKFCFEFIFLCRLIEDGRKRVDGVSSEVGFLQTTQSTERKGRREKRKRNDKEEEDEKEMAYRFGEC